MRPLSVRPERTRLEEIFLARWPQAPTRIAEVLEQLGEEVSCDSVGLASPAQREAG